MRLQKILAAAAVAFLTVTAAQAQSPVVTKIVTGSTPGAGLDLIARALAEQLSPLMKRNIIVENRPGATYNLAADYVAKAQPDGNTVLLTYMVHSLVGSLFPKLPFDPLADFKPVCLIASTPLAAVANPTVRGANLKEALALAKAEGRSLTFATPGMGTPQHLMMERLRLQTGVDIRMIHYKSAVQGQTEVIGGHVDLTLSSPAMGEAMVKAKMLKPLAVTGNERLNDYPDTPAATELGYDGVLVNSWYAVLLPAKTPPEIVKAYNEALNVVLASPAMIEKFKHLGLKPLGGSPETLDKHMRAQTDLWGKVIKQAGITLE